MASSSSDWPVHQLWSPSGGNPRTELDVVFFHGLQLTASDINDAWTSTWTQRGYDNVCWPQEWLPFDLGEAVRIFSVSYDVHVVTSPHDHVSEVADNLFQNLMDRRRDMNQLSVDFDRIVTENVINIYAFCEGRPTEEVVRMCTL
jgi:hypothetical protein